MDKIIKLISRNGTDNFLSKLKASDEKVESTTYVLKSTEDASMNYDEDFKICVSMYGGPTIYVGTIIDSNTVKNIDFVAGYGFLITFE